MGLLIDLWINGKALTWDDISGNHEPEKVQVFTRSDACGAAQTWPTSALAPISARLLEERFQHLKQNYTIVLVTHALPQAIRLADHVIFLYFGELIEHGPSWKIFQEPETKLTREFVNGLGEGI